MKSLLASSLRKRVGELELLFFAQLNSPYFASFKKEDNAKGLATSFEVKYSVSFHGKTNPTSNFNLAQLCKEIMTPLPLRRTKVQCFWVFSVT